MKQFLFAIILAAALQPALAQPRFVTKGKIEFERKTNVHRLYYSEVEGSWGEVIKKQVSQFRVDYFDLIFTEGKSLYKPGRENPEAQKALFGGTPNVVSIVFKDLLQQKGISQKQVYESQFLVTDSLPQIEWKMQSELRTIAGFECRKAVGRICDSVVVVAFYTDEIVPASGPESFHGLPGMILGLAIPRLYTTWFATKVELLSEGQESQIVAPTKGKKSTGSQLLETVNASIKDWGEKYRDKTIWLTTL